jgi:hypothetical protein
MQLYPYPNSSSLLRWLTYIVYLRCALVGRKSTYAENAQRRCSRPADGGGLLDTGRLACESESFLVTNTFTLASSSPAVHPAPIPTDAASEPCGAAERRSIACPTLTVLLAGECLCFFFWIPRDLTAEDMFSVVLRPGLTERPGGRAGGRGRCVA